MIDFLETKLFWITAAAVSVYLYLKYYVFNYWQRHGVACESPTMPLGNVPFAYLTAKTSIGNFIKKSYEKFCKYPFHGFYTFHKPAIMINDPELIKTILVKEFSKFQDRGIFYNDKVDPLSVHLFVLPGEKWKKLRAKLSPVFTTGKLKQMYPLFVEVSDGMISTFEAKLKHSNVVDVKDVISRYTTDIISSIAYGLQNSSLKDPKNEFFVNGQLSLVINRLCLLAGVFTPDFLEKLSIPFSNGTRTFFINIFKDMVEYRRKEKIVRNDFLNLLMQLMEKGEIEGDEGKTINGNQTNGTTKNLEKLDTIQAAAQAFVFFVAGFETASSTATYALLELASNSKIQDKLREEVDEMANTTGITYDAVMGNEYLEMVVSETLRKHPSVPILNRICLEDFPVPESNYTIPKGMRVIISASGIHRNPEFYPNPDKFDPMRFSKENVTARSNYTYLGFGDGPRVCIGKRFGQLETKQAIVTMLRNYKFSVSEKTKIPATYSTATFVQSPESGVHLRIEKRNV